jgi:hypothetical protein
MNTTFKIPITKTDAPANLIIEIGASNVAILCYSTFPFTATGFFYYTLAENAENNAIANELKSIFEAEGFTISTTDNVHVFYNYAESTFVPSIYFEKEKVNSIAALMFGNKTNYTNFNETIFSQKIENIYTIPNAIVDSISKVFPNTRQLHSLTMAIQQTNGTKLYATIYDKEIRIILFKENVFTISSYFNYTTPEDVCYHMLNVCERFEVNTTEVEVTINGMIDTSSNLYKEMYKFFMHLNIEQLPEKVELASGFEDIAAHYYTPLIKLAKCVS